MTNKYKQRPMRAFFPFDYAQGQNDKREQTTEKTDSSASLRNDKQMAAARLFAGAVAADEAGG